MSTFKKAQVKLLSTKESNIILNNKNQLAWLNVPLIYTERITSVFPHHIYIINDDEIKPNDWYYDGIALNVFKAGPHIQQVPTNVKQLPKKIIATTDKSLTKEMYTVSSGKYLEQLPTVSDYFIAYYIEAYNRAKPITDVLVEYQTMNKGYNSTEDEPYQEIDILKIDSNNTIFAKSPKNSWNREEVIQLLRDVLYESNYMTIPFPDGIIADIKPAYFNRWVEQNL